MYSMKFDDETFVAKARVENVDASFKDLAEVCGNIRRKKVKEALELLEKASRGEIPILYRRHNKKLGHRKELGGKKGRYPKKAAKIVLQVLKNALNNAQQKGLLEDNLIVIHASANKKYNYPRLQPKGRRIRHDYETARVEIILMEIGGEKKEKKEEGKEKAGEEGKEEKEKKETQKEEKGKTEEEKEKIKEKKGAKKK